MGAGVRIPASYHCTCGSDWGFPLEYLGRVYTRPIPEDARAVLPAPPPDPSSSQDTEGRADFLPVPRRAPCPSAGQDPPFDAIPSQHPAGAGILRVVCAHAGVVVENPAVGQTNGGRVQCWVSNLRTDPICRAPFPNPARICQVNRALSHGALLQKPGHTLRDQFVMRGLDVWDCGSITPPGIPFG